MSRRIRFHGGPYDGRVQDIADDRIPYVSVPMQSSPPVQVKPGLGPPHATVSFKVLTYELVQRRDGSWHAHTKRGMKMMRRNEEKRLLVHRARSSLYQGNAMEADAALTELERRL